MLARLQRALILRPVTVPVVAPALSGRPIVELLPAGAIDTVFTNADRILTEVGLQIIEDEASLSLLRDAGATCLLYTSPSPRDRQKSRMPSSA